MSEAHDRRLSNAVTLWPTTLAARLVEFICPG